MKKFDEIDVQKFLDGVDSVIFDCDGVIWLGSNVFENANTLAIKLRALNKKVFFITNNSTKSRDDFLVKFNQLGFESSISEIVSTSYLAALYLKEKDFKGKVYTIGTKGVTDELENVGIVSLPIGPDVSHDNLLFEPLELDKDVKAVVVGFDLHLSYKKLYKAASYLLNKDIHFIATNTDESFPSSSGTVPGTGSIVNAVKTAAGREPIVMGKPSTFPFEYLKRHHSLDPSRVLMVGDRDNTDILFGKVCGLQTLLVLTGVTQLSDIREDCIPDFYLESVGEFYELLKNH